jgi:hypothetical protein
MQPFGRANACAFAGIMGTLAIRKVACSTELPTQRTAPEDKEWRRKKRRDLLLRAFTFVNRTSFFEYSMGWSCGH